MGEKIIRARFLRWCHLIYELLPWRHKHWPDGKAHCAIDWWGWMYPDASKRCGQTYGIRCSCGRMFWLHPLMALPKTPTPAAGEAKEEGRL